VVLAGVVTGQVLSDLTGLPLTGATVQIIGGSGQDTSDNNGRYSIPSNTSHLFLSVTLPANATAGTPAMVTVEREVYLQSGVGTVPVDARMTPVAAGTSINASGGSLNSGNLGVNVAAGAVSSATNFYLTPLSQQGLPGLLPLGWSPVTAFDLRSDSATAASFSAAISQLPSQATLNLVQYSYNSHNWLMVTPNLAATNGSLSVAVPSIGDFALVVADAGSSAPAIPAAGQPLSGVSMVSLPSGASASGRPNGKAFPSTAMRPLSGAVKPVIALNSVVLPAPFGPIMP